MASPPLRLLGSLLLLGGASCTACPPAAQFLRERPDFRTPTAAGRSFLAALACDDAPAEYRCLAESLKARYGATLDAWILARSDLRAEAGGILDRVFALDPGPEESREEGVLVWWSWGGRRRLGLLCVQQHYWEIYARNGRELGAFLEQPPGALLEKEGTHLRLDLDDPMLRSLHDPATIRRLELGTEWKIAEIRFPDSSP